MNKSKRQALILSLIEKEEISTQEELTQRLKESGAELTQATASRDIKELGLIKVKKKSGKYSYAPPVNENLNFNSGILLSSVKSIVSAGNILCIKCLSGTASAAAAALDEMKLQSAIGTIAGDDTIFILAATNEDAANLGEKIKSMLGR
jgi:transcriptional regulator of arginine metabolism